MRTFQRSLLVISVSFAILSSVSVSAVADDEPKVKSLTTVTGPCTESCKTQSPNLDIQQAGVEVSVTVPYKKVYHTRYDLKVYYDDLNSVEKSIDNANKMVASLDTLVKQDLLRGEVEVDSINQAIVATEALLAAQKRLQTYLHTRSDTGNNPALAALTTKVTKLETDLTQKLIDLDKKVDDLPENPYLATLKAMHWGNTLELCSSELFDINPDGRGTFENANGDQVRYQQGGRKQNTPAELYAYDITAVVLAGHAGKEGLDLTPYYQKCLANYVRGHKVKMIAFGIPQDRATTEDYLRWVSNVKPDGIRYLQGKAEKMHGHSHEAYYQVEKK